MLCSKEICLCLNGCDGRIGSIEDELLRRRTERYILNGNFVSKREAEVMEFG